MVDDPLPVLRCLFLDLNSYFASVEQQEDVKLRNKPIIVVPMVADSTCAIAASYEAKKSGIRTGTLVGEAKRLCPDLIIVPAKPPLYTHYHRLVLSAVDTVLPVEKVCSIDEMRFRLLGDERTRDGVRVVAHQLKAALREHVGECMTCSIGAAQNSFLAKLGTDMQKPDGLVIIGPEDIPKVYENLKLTDFVGINRKMEARIRGAGIFTPIELYKASVRELRNAFGSIIGEKWWYLLRGHMLPEEEVERKSLSHSHVLPPELRSDDGCREVLLRLIQKATARMRANGLWAGYMSIAVHGLHTSWKNGVRMPPTHDTVTINDLFLAAWANREFSRPRGVGVTFTDLKESHEVTLSLFDGAAEREHLNSAVDQVNKKFGKNSIFLAGMLHAKDAAEEKIAFNKTWLFSEGKGDNEWPDTFRGPEPPAD